MAGRTRRAPARRATKATRRRSRTEQTLERETLETPQLANLEAEHYDGFETH